VTGVFAALADWLDDRTGFRRLRKHVLDEPLPAGTGWWFTLGSLLLFGLGVQVVTGIALALFYAPTPDHAWDSVRYITTTVRGGHVLRGLHYWGSTLVVVAAVAHLARVVILGSYRAPREVNWIVGIALLLVVLAFGLTGYLLPWDQRAYWATVVTINIARLTPLAGDLVAAMLRGGAEIGALTLTRWYAVHVLVLPAALIVLVAVHLYLLRRHGISGPVRRREGPARPFFPYHAARDVAVAVAAGVLLAALAWTGAPALEAPADPASNDYAPRPEWYFLGLFQLLKYFPGRLEIVGAIVIPGAMLAALVLLPWLDRAPARDWRARRAVLAMFAAGLGAAAMLTVLGAMDQPAVQAPVWNVREIAGATLIDSDDRCTRCHGPDGIAAPIEPGRIGRQPDWLAAHVADPIAIAPGVREPPLSNEADTRAIAAALTRMRSTAPPHVDPREAGILIIINRECLECHTIGGVGAREGPDLSGVGGRLGADAIERRITNPNDVQEDAMMPAFGGTLAPGEIRAIAEWLARRRE
jgi:ubiquinol-cytochrome c reductase cytochrome b subunit